MKLISQEENILDRCVSQCEKAVITHVLRRTRGSLPEAARLLGMNRKRFLGKLRKHGIEMEES